jgi:anaerobic magnesium-protoporphyrin IX monomethyl ester cyclase
MCDNAATVSNSDPSLIPADAGRVPAAGRDGRPGTAVIVPPVVCHNLDVHTGIPFMPHMAAHLAAMLRQTGHAVAVIDCFGLQPNHRRVIREFMLMGADVDAVPARLPPTVQVAFIYCRTIAEFIAVEMLIAAIRRGRPGIRIVLFENIQAVTSYSLRHVAGEFLDNGADVVMLGEPETRAAAVVAALGNGQSMAAVPGVIYRDGADVRSTGDAPLEDNLDELPFPAWDIFPLQGYWTAGFAHAPVKRGERFVPILTSRGCPYRCTFCIAPEVNPTWRGRSAANVVDEMEHLHRTLGVTDFHVSDLDPTISDRRVRQICEEILSRRLPITWKLAQGTKIETIKNEDTLNLMARAGCRFVSFSPESGSPRLLAIMNKPFDHEHGLRMARHMHRLGIRTQAVFVGGVPGETAQDRNLSVAYARKLVLAGVDELSLVIFAPLPGAALAKTLTGYRHYSECTPSPAWREDYGTLMAYRRRMYLNLFVYKLRYPRKVLREIRGLLTARFETKMEMSLFKQVKLYGLRYFPYLFPDLEDAPPPVVRTANLG